MPVQSNISDVHIHGEPVECLFSIGCYSFPGQQESNCTGPYKDKPTTPFALFRAQEYERAWSVNLVQATYPYLKQWGRQYVVQGEESAVPIEHGFLARRRYLSQSYFRRLYPSMYNIQVTATLDAIEAMCAFVQDEIAGYGRDGLEACLRQRYGGYDFYTANGPSIDASLGLRFGLFQERGGTIRLWSRVLYDPQ